MVDKKRRKPYVFTTWITKLLSGEQACWFAAWFKSNHTYDKTKDDEFDREGWQKKHDAIVNRREAELKSEGWTTRKEAEAEFIVEGRAADVAGKPDLVAVKGDRAIVVDGKSGRPKQADLWQVRVYVFALLLLIQQEIWKRRPTLAWLKNVKRVQGQVERPDPGERETLPEVKVPTEPGPEVIKDALREALNIIEAVKKVSTKDPQEASPGSSECRYCDVASCPHRYQKPVGDASGLW